MCTGHFVAFVMLWLNCYCFFPDDGLTIPLDNEVDSDIVSETVVVTTSPDDRSAEGIKEIPQLGLNIDESVTDSAGQTQSEVVDTPDVESQGYTR